MFGMSAKEWAITAATALFIFSFTLLTGGGIRVHTPIFHISDSYEMKRPENTYFRKFDLSGRPDQIEIVVGAPKKAEGLVSDGKPRFVTATLPPSNQKGKVSAAPPVDPKKKAKEEADKKKKALAEAARRKAKLSVTMIGNSRNGLSKSEPSVGFGGKTQVFSPEMAPQPAPAPKPQVVAADDTEKEDPKLSVSQWLSLLQNQPSNENAVKFKKAKSYLGNKAYYYDVLAKLLVDSQADRQNFAYNLLKGDVSRETFYFLANPTDELRKHDVVLQKVSALFAQYKAKSQFAILSYAMSIENTNSNLAAMAIVKELSAKIQSRSAVDTATGRDNTTASAPTAPGATPASTVTVFQRDDFKVFETSVKRLQTNKDSTVAQSAKSLYTTLWPEGSTALASTAMTENQ
jgi:hypothetical protein